MTRSRERGLTLIEVVIALSMASLVLTGTLTFFAVQSRAAQSSTELQTMQMGVRVALDRMLRDARSAAAGFSSGTVMVEDVAGAANGHAAISAVTVSNNTGVNGSDVLSLVFADGRGVTNSLTSDAVAKQTTPQDIQVLDITGFTATPPDNYVLVSNARDAILVQVTQVTAGSPAPRGTLRLAGMTGASGHAFPGGLTTFPGGSLILSAALVTYRIDDTMFGALEPALVVERGGPIGVTTNREPVATQIEDLQVALGFDGLGGGAVDNFITENVGLGANADEWAFNVVGDTAVGAVADLRELRITLVARSQRPRVPGADVLAVEDHAPTATGTTYLRRQLRGVAGVRNLSL